ncbi:MAG: YgdI/YgdR family lipoprotein [Desulfovibrio sp.]
MKKYGAYVFVVIFTLVLMGCGGAKVYQIETKSGAMYVSDSMPEYDQKMDTYTVVDEKDDKLIINKSEIAVIRESKKK